MEGFPTWLEETLNSKLCPLEQELQAQQSTLRDLLATVTTLSEARKPAKAPLADLPKPRTSERPRPPGLPRKGDEEQKSNKPVKSLGRRTSSSSGLRLDKKSPFQDADQDKEKASQVRKSVSSAKLLTNKTGSKAVEEKKTQPEAPVQTPIETPQEQPARPNYEAEIEELKRVSCIGRSTE
jgi:hypothetical protein